MRRVVVVSVLVLAGCGGAQPRTTAVPAPVASSAAVPSAPAEASTERSTVPSPLPRFPATKEGALAIGRAYFEEAGRAGATGDTAGFRSLVDPSCHCLALATGIEKVYAAKQHYEGFTFVVHDVSGFAVRRSAATVTVTYDVPPSYLVKANGERKPYSGNKNRISAVSLNDQNGQWVVIGATSLQPGTLTPP